MRTNKEKFDHYYYMMKAERNVQLDALFAELGSPAKYYKIGRTEMHELSIDRLFYYDGYFGDCKKPRREAVQRIKEYVDNLPPLDRTQVRVIGDSNDLLVKIEEPGNNYSFNAVDLEETQQANIIKYTLKPGDISCAYCGRAAQESEATTRKIISYATYGPAGRTNKYCSDKCGLHDQMAHEG